MYVSGTTSSTPAVAVAKARDVLDKLSIGYRASYTDLLPHPCTVELVNVKFRL
mgnify:CR=1 FL=1